MIADCHCQQYLSYILALNCRGPPLTWRKSLTNFIPLKLSRTHLTTGGNIFISGDRYLYYIGKCTTNYRTIAIETLTLSPYFLFYYKCGHRNVLSKWQVWMSIFHNINLKSGPVFLFQIFIIALLPLPRDIKLYH